MLSLSKTFPCLLLCSTHFEGVKGVGELIGSSAEWWSFNPLVSYF